MGNRFAVNVDGRLHHVDGCADAHTLSLIVDSGVSADPQGDAAGPPARSDVRRPDPVGSGFVYETTIAPAAVIGPLIVRVGAVPVAVTVDGRRQRRQGAAGAVGSGPLRIVAPMPGKVVRVLVKAGDTVHARQSVVVVEAMKMENELRADRPGTVAEIHAREGVSVDAGALVVIQ